MYFYLNSLDGNSDHSNLTDGGGEVRGHGAPHLVEHRHCQEGFLGSQGIARDAKDGECTEEDKPGGREEETKIEGSVVAGFSHHINLVSK